MDLPTIIANEHFDGELRRPGHNADFDACHCRRVNCAEHGELDVESDRLIHAYLAAADKSCPHCGTDLGAIERSEPTWPLLAIADHILDHTRDPYETDPAHGRNP